MKLVQLSLCSLICFLTLTLLFLLREIKEIFYYKRMLECSSKQSLFLLNGVVYVMWIWTMWTDDVNGALRAITIYSVGWVVVKRLKIRTWCGLAGNDVEFFWEKFKSFFRFLNFYWVAFLIALLSKFQCRAISV